MRHEFKSKFPLQTSDVRAQAGLRDVQLLCSKAKVKMLGKDDIFFECF